MYTPLMDKEIVRIAYREAINDGYSHASVARATKIGVSSLKNFYNEEGGFSAENVTALQAWLDRRGFMPGGWGRRDPFVGIVQDLRAKATKIEVARTFDDKRKILMEFVADISSDPLVVSLKNASEARDE